MLTITDNYYFGAAFKHKNASKIIHPEELLKKDKNKQSCIGNNTIIIVSIKNHSLLLGTIKLLLKFKIRTVFLYINSISKRFLTVTVSGIIVISGKLQPQKFIEIINQTQQKEHNSPIVKLEKIAPQDWAILLCLFRGLDRKIISTLFDISEKAISFRVNLVCSKLKIPRGNRPQKINTLEIFFTIYHSQMYEGKEVQEPIFPMAHAS
ncbi:MULTISPECIES: hypothetical protein [Enterobacter]|uniref:hypothetical protein n=1 Tax=Enterobacter TaxID=547 RepID=UPI001872C2D1|nr:MULTISPECIES: hypothetical protein [Enterobacter]MBE4832763.1 hypothetical protein [Enterobacter cloacae complex sp. P47BA]HDS9723392.1 hypothetical protein [Enterobacter bugandensis]